MCLLANTREGPAHQNKSLICLPMKTPGVSTKMTNKIGNHSSDTAMVFFEDVVVPRKNIIGEEGKGFTYQMLQFQEERMWGTVSGKTYYLSHVKLRIIFKGVVTTLYIKITHFKVVCLFVCFLLLFCLFVCFLFVFCCCCCLFVCFFFIVHKVQTEKFPNPLILNGV